MEVEMTMQSTLPTAMPAELGFAPERIQRLLDALQDEINRHRLPGCVALIARHGKIALFESLGFQQADTQVNLGHYAGFLPNLRGH